MCVLVSCVCVLPGPLCMALVETQREIVLENLLYNDIPGYRSDCVTRSVLKHTFTFS